MTMKLDMVELRKILIRVLAYLEVRRWLHTLEFIKLRSIALILNTLKTARFTG